MATSASTPNPAAVAHQRALRSQLQQAKHRVGDTSKKKALEQAGEMGGKALGTYLGGKPGAWVGKKIGGFAGRNPFKTLLFLLASSALSFLITVGLPFITLIIIIVAFLGVIS